ncbi:hypothetical protein HUA74_18340 [Myxococcus sp. CA051A]|uniref:hypothetical protein n=1 Tax=Myxococcus sp. CA051A TaxID=2741739 RepID=UPI00157AE135|nr:hypothetical protein [Myxococcus sp. CA051A]NTX62616.1 hypothetical protein [Myxococcus sp. CA051A]
MSPETRELVQLAVSCAIGPLSVIVSNRRLVARKLKAHARELRELRAEHATLKAAHAASAQEATQRHEEQHAAITWLRGAVHLCGTALGLPFGRLPRTDP